jgi:hypothetical protein
VFFEEPQAYVLSPLRNRSTGQELHYVNLHHLVAPLETTLQTAAGLLEATVTNVLIRYELFGYAGVSFLAAPPSQFPDAMETGLEQRCDDAYVEASSVRTIDALHDARAGIAGELLRPILHAFNYRAPTVVALRLRRPWRGHVFSQTENTAVPAGCAALQDAAARLSARFVINRCWPQGRRQPTDGRVGFRSRRSPIHGLKRHRQPKPSGSRRGHYAYLVRFYRLSYGR